MEQIRCSRQLKAEPQSPARTAEDCGMDGMCEPERESGNAGSNPSSAADLKPGEFLQVAPEDGGQRRLVTSYCPALMCYQ